MVGTMASFIPRKGPGGKRVWQAHVRRRGYPAQVRTFNTKAEAEVWAHDLESEMARGVFISRTEAEATTLGEALTRYLAEITPTKKPTTAYRERVIGRALGCHPLARRALASIRGKDMAAYMRQRQADGKGANTIRLELALLSHLFNVARTAWGMESLSNPVDLVKGQRPRLPQGRNRRLVDDEHTRLLTAAEAYGGEISSLITWAIETAMRRGEIAAMRWEHINRETGTLLIPDTKNGTAREVPLSPPALAVLDALPAKASGQVWSLRPDSITQAFRRVCKAAGITGARLHDMRHEATSRLFEKQGFNAMEVSSITGHKSMQMLKRYTHLRAEDLAKRMK